VLLDSAPLAHPSQEPSRTMWSTGGQPRDTRDERNHRRPSAPAPGARRSPIWRRAAADPLQLWARNSAHVEEMPPVARQCKEICLASRWRPSIEPTTDLAAAAAAKTVLGRHACASPCAKSCARRCGSCRTAPTGSSAPRASSGGTHAFPSGILAAEAPTAAPAILSGPSFAADVAAGLPTAVTLAARDDEFRAGVSARMLDRADVPALSLDRLRGAEIGGRRQETSWPSPAHCRRPRPRRQRRSPRSRPGRSPNSPASAGLLARGRKP